MIESTVIPKKRPHGSTNDLGLMGNPNVSNADQTAPSGAKRPFHGPTSPTKLVPSSGLYEGLDSGAHIR